MCLESLTQFKSQDSFCYDNIILFAVFFFILTYLLTNSMQQSPS